MKRFASILKQLFHHRRRTATVRYMFTAAVSIAAVMGASVITSTEASFVILKASNKTIEAGETFQVDVFAYAHVPVNAVDIAIDFEPESVEVLSVDRGQSVITIWTEEPLIGNDSVTLSGGTYRRGFLSEHKIATINLRAKETGPSTLSTGEAVFLAGDGEGTEVATVEAINTEIDLFIYDENTDPREIQVRLSENVITDINDDGAVSLNDVSIFMSAWQTRDRIYDFNGDGKMTFRDFSIILANFFFE